MLKQLSIEVCQDIATPDINPDTAIAGIDYINTITENALRIASIGRKIKIMGDNTVPIVSPELVRWPELAHDMRLTLTNRQVIAQGGENPLGFAMGSNGGNAIVGIKNAEKLGVDYVVAHELAHLFNLQPQQGEDHCENNSCLMFSHLRESHKDTSVTVGGKTGEYVMSEVIANPEFCNPCADQLAKRAFFMLKARNGEFVPEEWR